MMGQRKTPSLPVTCTLQVTGNLIFPEYVGYCNNECIFVQLEYIRVTDIFEVL
jgi:hypothetical protein